MSVFRSFVRNRSGTAAAEMALVFPFVLVLGMGAVEMGNYFLDEHSLVKAVRDGARYAARQDFSNYAGCTPTPANVSSALSSNVQNVVRTGQVAGGTDRLPNWSSATFSVQVSCSATYGSQTMKGIYTNNNNGVAPVVIVTASVPYRPVAVSLLFNATGYSLNAAQQAPVMGI